MTEILLSLITGLMPSHKFVQAVAYVSGHAPVERALTNAHMLFNISGVLVFAAF